jgi:uncharacterized protein YecE (DUF72 family)
MVLIGTSGFSYDDWKGPFYPADIRAEEMLPFYARHFSALEINYTYYRMPDVRTLGRMVEKTGGKLIFAVKAHQDITHTRGGGGTVLSRFIKGVFPLRESGTLGPVLVQFPWSFPFSAASLDYLKRLAEGLRELPAVVEFRHARWIREEVFDFLRRERLGFCCVDQPRLKGLVPPAAVATSPTAYVRFHGRNASKWWEHEESHERYDYLYTEAELREWVPRIRSLEKEAGRVFVFANNHFQAKAVANAKMLALLLEEERPAGPRSCASDPEKPPG